MSAYQNQIILIPNKMSKFRILKIENIDGHGVTETTYKIQKRFMFWFFDYKLTLFNQKWGYKHVYRSSVDFSNMLSAKR